MTQGIDWSLIERWDCVSDAGVKLYLKSKLSKPAMVGSDHSQKRG